MADRQTEGSTVNDGSADEVTNSDPAILHEMISKFTSSLAFLNIYIKGRVTFIFGDATEIEVQFQPPKTQQNDNLPTASAGTLRYHSIIEPEDAPCTAQQHLYEPDANRSSRRDETPNRSLEARGITLHSSSSSANMLHEFFTSPTPPDTIFAKEDCMTFKKHPSTTTDGLSSTISLPPFENIIQKKYPNVLSQGNVESSCTKTTQETVSEYPQDGEASLARARRGNFTHIGSHQLFYFTEAHKLQGGTCQKQSDVPESDPFIHHLTNINSELNHSESVSKQVQTVPSDDYLENNSNSDDMPDHLSKGKGQVGSAGILRKNSTNITSSASEYGNTPSNTYSVPRDMSASVSKANLDRASINVMKLNSLSHSELVEMLLRCLQDDISVKSLAEPHSSKDSQMKSYEPDTRTGHLEKVSKLIVDECKDTGKASKILTTSRKSKRKEHTLQHVNKCDPSFEADSLCAVSNQGKGSKMSLRNKRRISRKATETIENFKLKSEPSLQPLKKRDRLRSDIDNDIVMETFEDHVSDSPAQKDTETEIEGQTKVSGSDVMKSKEKIYTFSCKQCSKVFSSKTVYKRHVKTHSSGFQCDICGKTLKTKDSLYHHQRGLHTKNKPYSCRQCNTTFNFHHSYKLHMQRHKGERPHKCETCHKTYLTSNHLKVHIEAVHQVGSIVCHICGKTFSYSCTLKQHLHKHTGERPFHCDQCDKKFTTRQSLKAHAASHVEGKNYACHICGKLYKSEHSKNVHLKRHGKQVKKFMCELCGRAFYFKSTLNAHIHIHSKSRPYACKQCGKAFKSKASLYTHKYVHRDSLPFVCSICDKAFKTKNCLSAHIKRHENGESYPCTQCASTFPDKGGLSKHMKTIHLPKKQFVCKICGKKGTRCDNMRTHVKSHRNENTVMINPMDFIMEEAVTESDITAGRIPVRPRMRGPRHRNSKRLNTKDNPQFHHEKNGISQYRDLKPDITSSLATAMPVKSEMSLITALQSTLMNAPVFDHHTYSTHMPYIGGTSTHQDNMGVSMSGLAQTQEQPQQQQHHHHHNLQHLDQQDEQYHQEHEKYLTFMQQQPEIAGVSSNTSLPFGSMTSLLSAMTPSCEHDTINGNSMSASIYHNTLASLHTPHHVVPGNPRAVPNFFSETLPIQGSLTQLQQILSRSNENHGSVDHQRSTASLEDQGPLYN